jgi:hypothetical protein
MAIRQILKFLDQNRFDRSFTRLKAFATLASNSQRYSNRKLTPRMWYGKSPTTPRITDTGSRLLNFLYKKLCISYTKSRITAIFSFYSSFYPLALQHVHFLYILHWRVEWGCTVTMKKTSSFPNPCCKFKSLISCLCTFCTVCAQDA